MSIYDEEARDMLANSDLGEDEKAELSGLLNSGELVYITDGGKLVGFHIPEALIISDRDPGDETTVE